MIKVTFNKCFVYIFIGFSCCLNPVRAQQKYTPANIHSHNDYSRPDPFYHAFKAGVGAIEADIFLRNGQLMVSHDTAGIRPQRTLKSMYLNPLKTELTQHARPLNLLIDVKEAYGPSLARLLLELQPLKPFIRSDDNPGALLTIIITGNRPPPSDYVNYPSYISFDDDLQLPHDQTQWKRVAQVSLNFLNYSKWRGEGALPLRDEKVLLSVINLTHLSGKKIRFWGGPDTPLAWKKLMELRADILSTDHIDEVIIAIK